MISFAWFFAQIVVGAFYALFLEWSLHIFLHYAGTKKGQIFSFHFHQHHKNSRKNNFFDPTYENDLLNLNAANKELMSLVILSIPHMLLIPFAPFFFLTTVFFAGRYYYLHRKSHVDPEWCKKHMPWHYDHHMAPDQHANWGVTTDLYDRLFGTRIHYLGTERERRITQLRAQRAQRKKA